MSHRTLSLALLLSQTSLCSAGAAKEIVTIGLGAAFGALSFILLVFIISLKLYLDSIKVRPQFTSGIDDGPTEIDPNKLRNSSIKLRWIVPLSNNQERIIRVRFYILVICNRKMAPRSPCMVMIPANSDGSGEHTHEGVLIGDQLTFKVKAVFAPKYMRCFTSEGHFSSTLYFNGVSHRTEVDEEPPQNYGNEKTRLFQEVV